MSFQRTTEYVRNIEELPDEILEQILAEISPYKDFKSAMLVCKRWHFVMKSRLDLQAEKNNRREWTSALFVIEPSSDRPPFCFWCSGPLCGAMPTPFLLFAIPFRCDFKMDI